MIAPGLIVQEPAGKPFNWTLPVPEAHVVCVMVPTAGAAGVAGWLLITTLPEGEEVQPRLLVTVKLYVPEESPEIVVLPVLPVIPPGFIVQFPDGNPLKTTLPVETVQVGWVIVPTTGAGGITAVITMAEVGAEVQPEEFVTVNV